ncbi:MAG: YabP/YqfC family sporulation protein [Clostridiales bacterium]|nr:YabP/YqfC family sporulation protein [Clostridiales bacterium]
MEKQENPVKTRPAPVPSAHTLHLESRQKAALSGVREVLAFDENQVSLLTDSGEITLGGQGLHVTRLMLEEGQLTVEGRLDSIEYADERPRRGLWRRGG